MSAAELPGRPLEIANDPFMPVAPGVKMRIGSPLQKALGEIRHHVSLRAPLILVIGAAGTGKTLLGEMTARACSEMGLSVQQVNRGDMVHWGLEERSDVLVVDEADSLTEPFLETLSSEEAPSAAGTTVFLGLPTCAKRFNFRGLRPVVVELTSLTPSGSRRYLLETAKNAGVPNLFTAEALDRIVQDSRGTPRLLRSMASFAFFVASSDRASQIGLKHVGHVGAMQVRLGRFDGETKSQRVESLIGEKSEPTTWAHDDIEAVDQVPCKDEAFMEAQRELPPLEPLELSPETPQVLGDDETVGKVQQEPFAHPLPESRYCFEYINPQDANPDSLHDNTIFVERDADISAPLKSDEAAEDTLLLLREDQILDEGSTRKSGVHIDQAMQRASRHGETLAENQRTFFQTAVQVDWPAMDQLTTRRDQRDDSKIGRGTLLMIAAVVILMCFAFVSVLPSLLTPAGSEPAVSAPIQPLFSDRTDIITQPPAMVSSSATSVLPADGESDSSSASRNPEEVVSPKEGAGNRSQASDVLLPNSKSNTAGRNLLTEAEKRAIARGVEELKRAAAQAKR